MLDSRKRKRAPPPQPQPQPEPQPQPQPQPTPQLQPQLPQLPQQTTEVAAAQWTMDDLPSDTVAAVHVLGKQSSTPWLDAQAGIPLQIVSVHAVYSMVGSRTSVDRDLEAAKVSGALMAFSPPSDPTRVFVTTRAHYQAHLDKACASVLAAADTDAQVAHLVLIRAFVANVAAQVPAMQVSRSLLMELLYAPCPSGEDAPPLWSGIPSAGAVDAVLAAAESVCLAVLFDTPKAALAALVKRGLVVVASITHVAFALPYGGAFIAAFAKSIDKVISVIKASKYKEVEETKLLKARSMAKLPVRLPFLLRDMKQTRLITTLTLGTRTLLRLPDQAQPRKRQRRRR